MTQELEIPPVQITPPGPPELTDDLIPAIQANVIEKRVWQSIGSLFIWGCLNLFFRFYMAVLSDVSINWNDLNNLKAMIFLGGFMIPLAMIVFGLYGVVTRHPRIIIIDGSIVGLNGFWNIGLFLISVVLRDLNYWDLFWGVIQIFWGIKEFKKHKFLASWAETATYVTPEEKELIKSIVKRYRQYQENFFAGRLKAQIQLKRGIVLETKRLYYGKLCSNAGILVSENMDGYLRVSREEASVAAYKRDGRVNFETKLGEHKVRFEALSLLAWKQWAGVPIIENDLHWMFARGRVSIEVLKEFMRYPDPDIRRIVVQTLNRLGNTSAVPDLANEMLDDSSPSVCVSAINVCLKMKTGELHHKILTLLRNSSPQVRHAAAKYIAAFPKLDAIPVLVSVLQNEQDGQTQKQMQKALKACQKKERRKSSDLDDSDEANPYAWH